MKRSTTLLLTLLVTTIFALAIGLFVPAKRATAQESEKSLDIERYPDEPLELVDIQIRQHSVKSGIKSKSKDNVSKWGLDNVHFKEQVDWFKNVSIKLKNVTDKPIYGIGASLFLKHSGLRNLFRIDLKEHPNRNLSRNPLQPNEEIEFWVSEDSLNDMLINVGRYGIDPSTLPVSLSVDNAVFSDGLMWSRGRLLERDPAKPNGWRPLPVSLPPTSTESPTVSQLSSAFNLEVEQC